MISRAPFTLLLALISLPLQLQSQDLSRRGMLGAALETGADGKVVIRKVLPGGAAEAMKLSEGTIVLALNDTAVTSLPGFLDQLRGYRSGAQVRLAVSEAGKTRIASATLPPLPSETHAGATTTYGTARTTSGTRLRTILVAPTARRAPVILYLQGISCGTIDRPLAPETDTEMRMLQELLSAGYATLRVDRTGTGDSEGIPCSESGFDEEIEAARAALAWVRTRPDVDTARIVLLGVSMGGVVAPVVANEPGVTGVVVWGTIGRNFLEYQQRNMRRQFPNEGLLPEQAESTAVARTDALARLLFLNQTPAQVKAVAGLAEALPVSDSTHMFGRHARFFQQLQRLDTPRRWAGVKRRALILHGEYDWVSDPEDHALIAEIVNRSGGNAVYQEVPGLDHATTHHASLEDSRQNYGEGAPSSEVMNRMRAWLETVLNT